jgi:hypothetical protein
MKIEDFQTLVDRAIDWEKVREWEEQCPIDLSEVRGLNQAEVDLAARLISESIATSIGLAVHFKVLLSKVVENHGD